MKASADASKRFGFLARLRKDETGNILAMMAAGLIPLVIMIGSGVDVSRTYLVKSRLQQSCDAGALAGRKTMGVNTWAANSGAAAQAAQSMFEANFSDGRLSSQNLEVNFTETSGTVNGTASVELPMTLMKYFGKQQMDIEVTCQAELAIPNTDVMFVLDTTGSMNRADDGSNNQTAIELSNSKIVGLRQAVRCFYEALSKQDTVADCGSTPSGAAQTAQIRFGFVPYAVNVNVGRLLPTDYFVDSWTYQSRVPVISSVWAYTLGSESPPTFGSFSNPSTPTTPTSGWTTYTTNNTSQPINVNGTVYQSVLSQSSCPRAAPGAYTVTGAQYDTLTATNSAAPVHPAASIVYGSYTRTIPQTRWFHRYAVSGSRCRLQWVTRSFDRVADGTSNKPVNWTNYPDIVSNWQYRPVTHNVSGLKNGNAWRTAVNMPVGFNEQNLLVSGSTTLTTYKRAANVSAVWDGCVEERQTIRATNYYPIDPAAKDLDIDLIPTADTTTRWAPVLPAAVWGRYTGSATTTNTDGSTTETTSNVTTYNELIPNYSYSCPQPASPLTIYDDEEGADAFDAYVAALSAEGGTHHDSGLIWGARLISPTGLFAAENANRNNIKRHVVFMTDGATETVTQGYSAYGIEWWDRRRTPTSTAPTQTTLNAQVNSRFLAMCNYMKNDMGVEVWVIAFGAGITAAAQANLDQCASPGRSRTASNSAALIATFQSIASDISDLRLTQ